jgi:O-antigen/teichoic acid export membrane protein
MTTTKRSISSDSISTFFYSGLSSALTVATGVLIARWLGPVGKGVFSGLGLLQSGVAAATGGVGAAITYLLTKKARTISGLLSPLAALLVLVSILTWVGLLVWGAFHGYSGTWLIFFVSVPASVVLSWQGYLFLGLGRVRVLNRVSLARGLLLLVLLLVAVKAMGQGLNGSLVAWAAAAYGSAIFVVVYALMMGRPEGGRRLQTDLSELLRFGSRSSLDGILGFLAYRIDSLIIIAFLGAAGFGLYSVAVAGGEVLYMISRSVATASANAIGSTELSKSAQITAKAVRTTTAAIGVMALILCVLAPMLVKLLYGDRFAAAALPFQILLPGVVAFSSAGIFSSFFSYQLGRPMFGVYLTLALLVIESVGCLTLIPRMGLVGAAVASTVTYLASTIGETWYFCKVTGMSPWALWIITRGDLRGALHSLRAAGNTRGAS